MLNMIKMDLYRMFRTKSMYIVWIVLAVAVLFTTFMCKTDYDSLNFGQCKGMTFDRVAIFPNKKYKEFLQKRTSLDSPCKYYVSATRAKYSIVFVVEKLFENDRFKYMNIKLEDSSIKVSKYMV